MYQFTRNILGRQKRKVRLFFTGLAMGIADLVPGVSGGTIAFLFGIYDELLYTIKLMTGQIPRLVFTGKFKQALSLIPFSFLLPVGAGILLAIFGLVHIVSYLLDTQPTLVWALFFGLILGSVYVISRRVSVWTMHRFLLMGLGFTITFVVVGLPSTGGSDAPLAIFGTGVVAITAMILPGISGSLIMVLLGQYEVIINAITEREFSLLATFAAGAIVGLAAFVRILTWLLKRYHTAVIVVLTGIMAGSLRRIWPWQTTTNDGGVNNFFPVIELSLLWALLLVCAGFIIVVLLERYGVAKEHDDINTKEFKREFTDIENN
jgi:putative membrane protein